MKQILQNMVKFEKPKVVLVSKKVDDLDYIPVLRKLDGYIISLKYDEEGNICGEETVYFDDFGSVELGLEEIHKEFIPGEKVTYEDLLKRDFFKHNSISNVSMDMIIHKIDDHYYNNYYDSQYTFEDFCKNLEDLGINVEFPKELYDENTTLGCRLRINKKDGDFRFFGRSNWEHLSVIDYKRRLGRDCGVNSKNLITDLESFVEDVSYDISSELLYRRDAFGFKYNIEVKSCDVTLKKNESDNKEIERLILEAVNKHLRED